MIKRFLRRWLLTEMYEQFDAYSLHLVECMDQQQDQITELTAKVKKLEKQLRIHADGE